MPCSDIVIREYKRKDAGDLLRMWKEGQSHWPGGISVGTTETPDEFHRGIIEGRELAHFVAEDGSAGRVIGYVSFAEDPVRYKISYLPLLNVHPEWHGRGVGKALILRVIRESARGGYRRLDLGTWPGNDNVICLYKRTGFFWVPESDVFMVNYIPQILNVPLLKTVFKKSNWYDSMSGKVKPVPDDDSKGRMRIYRYTFFTESGKVRIVVDRNANLISGIESTQYNADLLTDNSDGWRGFKRTVTWRFTNRESSKKDVRIEFRGLYGIRYRKTERIQVDSGHSVNGLLEVEVPLKLKHRKPKPYPVIQAEFTVDGRKTVLATGWCPLDPIKVELDPEKQFIPPSESVHRTINFHQVLTQSAKVNLSMKPDPGLTVRPMQKTLTLGPESIRGIPFEISGVPGKHTLSVSVSAEGKSTGSYPDMTLQFATSEPGSISSVKTDKHLFIRNDFYLLRVYKDYGVVVLESRSCPESGMTLSLPSIGPPFGFDTPEGQIQTVVKKSGNDYRLTIRGQSPYSPDVSRQLTLYLSSSPVIRMASSVSASVVKQGRRDVIQSVGTRFTKGQRYISTRDGILYTENPSFPFGKNDLPNNQDYFPEKWTCMVNEDAVAGLIWTGEPSEIEMQNYEFFSARFNDIGSVPEWRMPIMHLYIGPGSYRTVQILSRQISKSVTPPLQLKKVIHVQSDQIPMIIKNDSEVVLSLVNYRNQVQEGILTVEKIRELKLRTYRFQTGSLAGGKTKTVRIPIQPDVTSPCAIDVSASYIGKNHEYSYSIPAIIFPKKQHRIVIENQSNQGYEQVSIQNGDLQFDVTPEFSGSVTKLAYRGHQLLRSPFPKPGLLGFESPWYGGITPEVAPTKFERAIRERWIASHIHVKDVNGNSWQGVRIMCKIRKNKTLSGLTVVCEYLTSSEIPILAVRMRAFNRTRRVMTPVLRPMITPQAGSEIKTHRIGYHFQGKHCVRHWCEVGEFIQFSRWSAMSGLKEYPSVAIVPGSSSRKMNTFWIDTGRDGFYQMILSALDLDPRKEGVLNFFICPFYGDASKGSRFASLSEIRFNRQTG
jgi:ribosomal protein S18 acetylase RimI-like enzyme